MRAGIVLTQRDFAPVTLRRRRVCIPANVDHSLVLREPLASALYYNVLYAAAQRRAPKGVKYSIQLPDGWLLAMAAVMWEGIVQGAAWDAIKASVNSLLSRLGSAGLAPMRNQPTGSLKATATFVGFHYTEYFSSGRKQRELFLGLQRVHRSRDDQARDEISGSFSGSRTSGAAQKQVRARSEKRALPKNKTRKR